ncbi:hypothetical protein HJG60_008511 [Phyllostomus discolor]|uniref:[F-actin]-monooxygenase MICAL1-3-like Rossman domain-containing protein n=1 Tax=Phyllostomus discolor TaxID=89673 RepID=A0A834DMC6_9CHIR|nr:hypothetical protein HJG60_008511 [Phyllostomus discolor]
MEETQVPKISSVARIHNQSFSQSLLKVTGTDLENIVYYKNNAPTFANVEPQGLQGFACAVADIATHSKLRRLEFAQDAHGWLDISAFDFTSMVWADSFACAQEKHSICLLLGLVGECLLEPF